MASLVTILYPPFKHRPNQHSGINLIAYCLTFLLGVNCISYTLKAPTHYDILTALSETEFSDVEVTGDNGLVVNGLIGSNTFLTCATFREFQA